MLLLPIVIGLLLLLLIVMQYTTPKLYKVSHKKKKKLTDTLCIPIKIIKICDLIYLECSSFLVLYSISSVARLMHADKRRWLLYFLTAYSRAAPVRVSSVVGISVLTSFDPLVRFN